MAKVCAVCGKKPRIGSNISHAHNISSRRFNPNVHKMKISIDGRVKSAYVCTRCVRSGKVNKVV
jgi:large subunit ribosomal protein L28